MRRLDEVELLAGVPVFDPGFSGERLVEAQAAVPALDWSLISVLRRRASERISVAVAQQVGPLSEVDRRLLGRSIVRVVVREHVDSLSSSGEALWPVAVEQACAVAVEDAIFGYGRLQPLFEIPGAENVEIHGCDSVVVQFGDGRREQRAPVADSDQELVEAVRFLGEGVNPPRPFDDAHPMLTLGELGNPKTGRPLGQHREPLRALPPMIRRISPRRASLVSQLALAAETLDSRRTGGRRLLAPLDGDDRGGSRLDVREW